MRIALGKLYLFGWVLTAVASTFMAISQDLRSRLGMLIIVLVLQHVTFLLFMVDYDRLASLQWKRKVHAMNKPGDA